MDNNENNNDGLLDFSNGNEPQVSNDNATLTNNVPNTNSEKRY